MKENKYNGQEIYDDILDTDYYDNNEGIMQSVKRTKQQIECMPSPSAMILESLMQASTI